MRCIIHAGLSEVVRGCRTDHRVAVQVGGDRQCIVVRRTWAADLSASAILSRQRRRLASRASRSRHPSGFRIAAPACGCNLRCMNPLAKVLNALRPKAKNPEDLAAEVEAKRLQDRNLDVRLSQRSSAGENYQSGRGSR